MDSMNRKPMAGDTVVLDFVPLGLVEGFPEYDQAAISEIVGKSVLWLGTMMTAGKLSASLLTGKAPIIRFGWNRVSSGRRHELGEVNRI
jgi:hypothetical protein